MNLITVTNQHYLYRAINLICSYISIYPDSKVFLFTFPPIQNMEIISGHIPQLEVHLIPEINEYIYNPYLFLYKTYALKEGYSLSDDSVIYLDAAFMIVKRPESFENRLKKYTRVFIPYPKDPKIINEVLTTQKCFEALGCNDERYKKSNHYWAAIQAYEKTSENKCFIDELHSSMLNLEIAGPESKVPMPDGPSGLALSHRNDQSVLSILIEKYGFQQPFDCVAKDYSDLVTLLCGYTFNDFSKQLEGINQPIQGRHNTVQCIPPEILKEIS